MFKLKEQPREKIVYPTEGDLVEIERRAKSKINPENEGSIKERINILRTIAYAALKNGWNAEYLKDYNEEKEKLENLLARIS